MNMWQLVDLIGLASTNPKIVDWFTQNNLAAPPKTITANQRSKDATDKTCKIYYHFKFDITNDLFYPPVSPKNDDYTFICYLNSILVYDRSNKKTNSNLSKTLWNDFIGPDTNFDECCKFFNGQFKESKNSIFFSKPLNDFTEIKVWFSTDKKKLDTIELAIIEHAELVGQYDFKETNPHNTVKQAYTLLVKWLFDRQYLLLDKSVYAAGLSQNHAEVLVFTKTHLRNHIWDNQIVSEPDLRSFLFKIKSNGTVNLANGEKVSMYIRNLFMQAAGLWQKHQDLYENESMDQVVALENSTHLDEKQSQEFFKLLDVNLEMITKIGLAPLNW